MYERIFPGTIADLSAMPAEVIGETSAMASLASLGLDWILASETRFRQFIRETAELHHADPAQCVTYQDAKHLAEHAEDTANLLARIANESGAAAELDQQAAEEHDEQASQARHDPHDI